MKFFSTLAVATYFILPVVNAIPLLNKRQANFRLATAEEETLQRYYMTLAGNAYCPTVIPGGKWQCPNCNRTENMEIVQTFVTPVHDTNAMVVRDDVLRRIIVTFRGSQSQANFDADNDWRLIAYPLSDGARVHRGFYNSYEEIADQIIPVIEQQVEQYPDYTLAATGHSLGGATSLLCALDLQNRGFDVELFSQGSPRVGDREFAQYIVDTGLKYTRLTNKRDLFVDIPPTLLGYRHAGEEYWIRADEKIQVCANGLETDYCYNSGTGRKTVEDHMNYFELTSNGECPDV
ncbi:Alpha/Beta hydrolase protein [Phascolomyces articulosus]|uniref:Alpha/Beta hydrolase protein n=1 Tax=Phascolomyces articulosus TaxID=60185 RepID=A0AAD5K9N3_9FUNG|nr:Alpha/Beta hydrolase protein [Phascolomyces articulosus]